MGRKKKDSGGPEGFRALYPGQSPRGKDVRVMKGYVTAERALAVAFGKRLGRGKTGRAWRMTAFLKERAPLVYAFIVDELRKGRKSPKKLDRDLQQIIQEWKVQWEMRRKPWALEITAYVIERALGDAWEVWGLKRPYRPERLGTFFRRYVHGHPGAIRVYREALRMPKPWERGHVGHVVKAFLGPPGEVARRYDLLDTKQMQVAIVKIEEEE